MKTFIRNNTIYQEGTYNKVELFRDYDYKTGKEGKWQVNWSGCGSKTPVEAKEYAELILLAVAEAEKRNSEGV